MCGRRRASCLKCGSICPRRAVLSRLAGSFPPAISPVGLASPATRRIFPIHSGKAVDALLNRPLLLSTHMIERRDAFIGAGTCGVNKTHPVAPTAVEITEAVQATINAAAAAGQGAQAYFPQGSYPLTSSNSFNQSPFCVTHLAIGLICKETPTLNQARSR